MYSRPIKAELKDSKLVITIPELGYELECDVDARVSVDPITEYPEDEYPDFGVSLNISHTHAKPLEGYKTRKESFKYLKNKSVIPKDLEYTHAYVGFVYSSMGDPNNYKWWIDLRDKFDTNVYNFYAVNLKLSIPVTTHSWFMDNFYHGRFMVTKKDLKKLLMPDDRNMEAKGICKASKQNIIHKELHKKTKFLRIRYDIKLDHWYCDSLDKDMNELTSSIYKKINIAAPMKGYKDESSSKPKASMIIEVKDVKSIETSLNSLSIIGN